MNQAAPKFSFLFRIEPIESIFDRDPPRLGGIYGWTPPRRHDLYLRHPGQFYRWQDGNVAPIQDDPIFDSSSSWCYKSASIFTHGGQFLATPVDVTRPASYEWSLSLVGFHHIPSRESNTRLYSYLDFAGEFDHLAAPDLSYNNWTLNLFPNQLQRPSNQPNPGIISAGVIGCLPLLLSMAAFSGPAQFLQQVLLHSMRNVHGRRRWIQHPYGNGCKPFLRVL